MAWVRSVVNELRAWEWLGLLVARIAVGLLFFLSGRGKLFIRERREVMRQTMLNAHIPFPEFNTLFVSILEFLGGALLVLGALTPLVCLILGGVMTVAIATTAARNIQPSAALDTLSEVLYLPEVLCLVILLLFFLLGPGWFSVDALLF